MTQEDSFSIVPKNTSRELRHAQPDQGGQERGKELEVAQKVWALTVARLRQVGEQFSQQLGYPEGQGIQQAADAQFTILRLGRQYHLFGNEESWDSELSYREETKAAFRAMPEADRILLVKQMGIFEDFLNHLQPDIKTPEGQKKFRDDKKNGRSERIRILNRTVGFDCRYEDQNSGASEQIVFGIGEGFAEVTDPRYNENMQLQVLKTVPGRGQERVEISTTYYGKDEDREKPIEPIGNLRYSKKIASADMNSVEGVTMEVFSKRAGDEGYTPLRLTLEHNDRLQMSGEYTNLQEDGTATLHFISVVHPHTGEVFKGDLQPDQSIIWRDSEMLQKQGLGKLFLMAKRGFKGPNRNLPEVMYDTGRNQMSLLLNGEVLKSVPLNVNILSLVFDPRDVQIKRPVSVSGAQQRKLKN